MADTWKASTRMQDDLLHAQHIYLGLMNHHSTYFSWAVTVQKLNGEAYLIPCRINSSDDGEQVFKSIRSCLGCVPSAHVGERLVTRLFTKVTGSVAEIRQVRGENV